MTDELRDKRGLLLDAKVRQVTAEADLAEIELGIAQEKERDRNAGTGLNRILNINTPIFGDYTDAYINALEHWGRREYDSDKPVTLNINSPGGSVMDGLALYDTIQRLRRAGTTVITRGTGLVASMAVILLQAGDIRLADSNVQILVHELSSGGGLGGKISGIVDEAAMMERLNKRLLGILAERSTMSAKQIENRAARREWWLDAPEALKLGFVDKVE